MRQEQISVSLAPELRRFVERVAAGQERTVSAVIRRLVAEAAQKDHRPQEARAS